ncbi:MAG: hypothetical protein HC796_04800 [Synechococcaceae cyanobacterium RL_1_2]|nr:hypothetical protein [Synechococcaceae cyanobacterium RL_1_2]
MMQNLIDRLGEFNPQLFREIKGRIIRRNIFLTIAGSIIFQFLILIVRNGQLPRPYEEMAEYSYPIYSGYCLGGNEQAYSRSNVCDVLQNDWHINWQLFHLDSFVTLAIASYFILLVAGTYLLIADLAKEERRHTLDFLRLTPQSAWSIMTGKLLGVPSLVYLFIALTIPYQLFSAIGASINPLMLMGYGLLVAASAMFFFTAGMFLALIVPSSVGFKPWLGSGTVLFFLWVSTAMIHNNYGDLSPIPPWIGYFI